jgi:hypothetical protein
MVRIEARRGVVPNGGWRWTIDDTRIARSAREILPLRAIRF